MHILNLCVCVYIVIIVSVNCLFYFNTFFYFRQKHVFLFLYNNPATTTFLHGFVGSGQTDFGCFSFV